MMTNDNTKTWFRLEYRAADLQGRVETKAIEFPADSEEHALELADYYQQPGRLPSDAERFVLMSADGNRTVIRFYND